MTPLILTIEPRTAFASPLLGDTLFGQLCWTLRHMFGEKRIGELLADYAAGRPFLVVSDAFPQGYLPLPHLPGRLFRGTPRDPKMRKAFKKIIWMPADATSAPLIDWQRIAAGRRPAQADFLPRPQPRNSLDRLTLCTGEGAGFSPYTVRQLWPPPAMRLDVHLRLDEARLTREELLAAWAQTGALGFGKDAHVGLGKFAAVACRDADIAPPPQANAWLTLAPCAPQGLGFDPARSYYKPFTRYGRHGDMAARLGNAFKQPVLLSASGGVFAAPVGADFARGFIGQGLGGEGKLSDVLRQTVHQGYAPVLPIHLPEDEA